MPNFKNMFGFGGGPKGEVSVNSFDNAGDPIVPSGDSTGSEAIAAEERGDTRPLPNVITTELLPRYIPAMRKATLVRTSVMGQTRLILINENTGEPVTMPTFLNTILSTLQPQFLSNLEYDVTTFTNAYVYVPGGLNKWQYLPANRVYWSYGSRNYRYREPGKAEIQIPPEQIIHVKRAGPLFEQSPLAIPATLALMPYAEAAYAAARREAIAQKAHMVNSRSLIYLDKEERWSGTAIQNIKRWLNGGSSDSHLVAEGKAGQLVIGGQSDPEFIAKQEALIKQVARVTDVPAALLDDLDDATYSNFSNIRKEWIQRVIPGMVKLYEDAFNNNPEVLQVPAGQRIIVDITTIPELDDDIDTVIDRVMNLVSTTDSNGESLISSEQARAMLARVIDLEPDTSGE